MKICVLSNFRSLHVRNRARCLAGLGHDVEAWSLSAGPGEMGIAVKTIPFEEIRFRPLRWLSHARHLWRFAKAIRAMQADVYYLQYAAQMECWLALAAGANPMVVGTMGGDVLMDEQGNLTTTEATLTRLVLKSAAAVTSKSDLITARLLTMGVEPERITKIVWGVDLKTFRPIDNPALRSRFGLAAGDKVVLCARSLTRFYNAHMAVEAFRRVASRMPEAKLLIVTHAEDPAYRRQVEAQIANAQLGAQVRLIGAVPHDEMPELYAVADVCVSLAPSDGLPMSVMEAMACGIPVVLTDLDRYRELAEAETEAVYVPLAPDAVAAALIRILADGGLRARLSSAARAAIEAKADMTTDLARMSALLNGVHAQAGHGRPVAVWRGRALLVLKLFADLAVGRIGAAKVA